MRVIGIDPGLQIAGYAVVEMDGDKPILIEAGCIRTKQKDSTEKKLAVISKEIGEVIAEFNPDVMAVEDLYSHYNHPKTAIIMGHARGVILLKAAEANLKVHIYAATRIKNSLTGNGRAPKSQMQLMTASLFDLTRPPEPPDIADAMAVAVCHLRAVEQDNMVEA